MYNREQIIKGLEYSYEYIKERSNPTAVPKAMAMENIKQAVEYIKDRPDIIYCKDCKWFADKFSVCSSHRGLASATSNGFCCWGEHKNQKQF